MPTAAPKRNVSRATIVLDASALLVVVNGERGADRVEPLLQGSSVSAVNWSEAIAKLTEAGIPEDVVLARLSELELDVVPFDRDQATLAGLMRAATRAAGLSLGDRACLALASTLRATAVTADRAWAAVDVGVPIEMVR